MSKPTYNTIIDNPYYQAATNHLKTLFKKLANNFQNSPHIGFTMKVNEPQNGKNGEVEKAIFGVNTTHNDTQRLLDLYVVFNSLGDGTDNFPKGAAFIKRRYDLSDKRKSCPIPEIISIDNYDAYDRAFIEYENFLRAYVI